MKLTVSHLERLKRLHQLLLLGQTGSPEACAKTLNISPRTLRGDLQILKDWGGQVAYDRKHTTYFYTNCFDLQISIEIKIVGEEDERKIYGGCGLYQQPF